MTEIKCRVLCKHSDAGLCNLAQVDLDECGGCLQFDARYTCGDCAKHETTFCSWYKLLHRHPGEDEPIDGSCFAVKEAD